MLVAASDKVIRALHKRAQVVGEVDERLERLFSGRLDKQRAGERAAPRTGMPRVASPHRRITATLTSLGLRVTTALTNCGPCERPACPSRALPRTYVRRADRHVVDRLRRGARGLHRVEDGLDNAADAARAASARWGRCRGWGAKGARVADLVMSAVVGRSAPASTRRRPDSTTTASVLVPPTSTPITTLLIALVWCSEEGCGCCCCARCCGAVSECTG